MKLFPLYLVAWAAAGSTFALQSSAPPYPSNWTSNPISVGHAVANLTSTVRFYRDLTGLVVLSEDTEPVTDAALGQFTNTTGATYKTATIAIPNQSWTLKLTEYAGISKEGIRAREQAPAAPGLTLSIKNASLTDSVLAQVNATTVNGQPVPSGGAEGTTSTVWVYDPDNYMVELVQRSGASDYFTVPAPNITDGPGMKWVVRGQLDLTMYNYTQALTFYKGILGQNISAGFEPLIGPNEYEQIGGIGSVFNISENVTWAAVTGNCNPDTRCEYYEYDDPDRVSIIYPAQDPGVGITEYNVQDLDGILAEVKNAGLTFVTEGSVPVTVDGKRSVLIRDPSGYLVRLGESSTPVDSPTSVRGGKRPAFLPN